ncbi:MAG: metal ABC transporter permease [Myxococcota bacterium]|jgi:zinc transport system permease protein|nr:metal ABC transporter permease [Myxococcota bacterium]
MFEFAFMQRALVAAIAIGIVCGLLGFFVVLRRLSFIGVGISHSALGGVAVGLLLGIHPLLAGAVFALAVALGIAWLGPRTRLSEDAIIGVFFSASMALGVVLFSMQRGYQQDLFGYLFGNVLAISNLELTMLLAAGAGIALVLAALFRPLLFIAFDDEIARAYGQRVDATNAVLLILVALTVVIGVRLVGVLLVQALLVIPAASAALWTAHYRGQLVLATGLGAGCGAAGLALAYQLDLAAGGTIVLVATAAFAVSALAGRMRA